LDLAADGFLCLYFGNSDDCNVNFAKINLPAEVSPAFELSSSVAKESLKEKFFLGAVPANTDIHFLCTNPKLSMTILFII